MSLLDPCDALKIATASIAPVSNRAGRISLMYEAALLGDFSNVLPPLIIAPEPSG